MQQDDAAERPRLEGKIELPPRKKWGGLRGWWRAHKPTKRRLIQVYAALLTNANLKGFVSGRIYVGGTKNVCAPGLNCYSCPGAVASCPLGSLQNALAQSGTRAPYYVFGIIMLWGLIFARTVCGFLCPVGLGQELLYKIKTPKLKKGKITRVLSYLKYVLLAVLVIALPLIYGLITKTAVPAFCKYICPAGTLGGGIALLANPANADMYGMLHGLFTWKFCVLVGLLVLSVFIYRVFCRFLCPLGALYGFFNKFSLLGVKLDEDKCTSCGLCVSHCKMDIRKVGDHECINCGECISVCPSKAISFKGSQLFIHPNEVPQSSTIQIPPTYAQGPINELAPTETEGAKEQKPHKHGRCRAFWLQFAAWCTALAVLAGALVYYNLIDKPVQSGGNAVGEVCYDFTLPEYGTQGSYTLSNHRGKIVLINFWATWCGPCVTELPEFERLCEEYDDVEVVAIHSANVTEDVQSFLQTKADIYNPDRMWSDWQISFVQDSGDVYHSDVYDLLGGRDSYPVTLIVDRSGVIQFVRQGSITYSLLKMQIDLILFGEQ